jgi:2-dehydro-3-deoxyglucarate aldolase/4-hydroxy-2-oxoheptanedioate aldolase
MMKNKLKQSLREGKPCLGTVLTISSPVIAEIMALAEFDWLWFDLEHTPMSLESLQSMLQAANGYPVSTVVRVPGNDEVLIKRVLDLGPDGIIVPLVNTPEQARSAVSALKYPPLGVRGAGIGRAQGFGEGVSGDYFETANEEILLIAQIEHIDAVNNIEAILEVDGVDSVFLGPLDLSGSMGLLGKTNHPDVEAAVRRVRDAAIRKKVPAGIMTMSPEQAAERIREGYRTIGLGIDVDSLATWGRNAVQFVKQANV